MRAADQQEISKLDATGQAALVARGELTPGELVEAAIARIERVNPRINAVVTPLFEEARKTVSGPLPDGPLRGVPYLLKDLLAAYGGAPQTYGSAFLRGRVPPRDSELVARLKRAGLVVVGKTNTPEFGILPTTEPALFGACRNPWNPEHSTGGSSGGSAAAVAARLVPAAHGNDGGGSIRIPASCCGVFGLKPTRGRTPLGPDFGEVMSGFVVEHALTLSVRDSALLLDATAGPDVGDPYWAPPPERPFRDEVGRDPGRLRIAFSTDRPSGEASHPDCAAAVREVASLCERLGHFVEEVGPALDAEAISQAFTKIYLGAHAAEVADFSAQVGREPRPGELEPLTEALWQAGRQVPAGDYLLALQMLHAVSRDIARFFQDVDLWLLPTIPEPPLPLGSFDPAPDNPLAGLGRAAEIAPFTVLCNFTGMPGMSVPLVWNGAGLPIGTQFVGRFGDEATLLRLAAQLEAERPWADRRPPICA